MAFNPNEGLVFIPVTTEGALAQVFADDPAFRYRDGAWNTAINFNLGDLPNDEAQRVALKAMLRGRLVAWDPVARKPRWSVELPSFWNAGVLATAGGLVFQGAAEGALHAYDATDGKRLWSYETTNGIIAAPMTYALDGEQYVAVMVGYGGAGALSAAAFLPDRPRLPGRIMVFKLGATAQASPYVIPPKPAIDLTGVSSRGNVAAGRSAFNANCLVCHSANASGGYLPDLRRSANLADAGAFRSIVIDGALAANGMIGFERYLDAAQAENIRAFLITEARRQQGIDAAAARQAPK
jgi:mono/diheme cytochrome c family protein